MSLSSQSPSLSTYYPSTSSTEKLSKANGRWNGPVRDSKKQSVRNGESIQPGEGLGHTVFRMSITAGSQPRDHVFPACVLTGQDLAVGLAAGSDFLDVARPSFTPNYSAHLSNFKLRY